MSRRSWLRDWFRAALVLGIAGNVGLLVAGHTISPWAGVGLPAVAAVFVATGFALRRPDGPVAEPGAGPPTANPAPLESYVRLRQRVRWAADTPPRMGPGLHSLLIALSADRLQRRHGIDQAAQPAEAAALTGPELWAVVGADEAPAGLDIGALARLTTRLESL